MIETPVKAQGGALAAPPPDPRLRESDPPPDPGSRYEHACVECGSPLHPDQAACLNCGAMVDHGDGGAGIRRAALGSVTALLVLGGAVGAAVAGLPHGKHVPKPATAQVFGPKKAIPPATAGSNGTGTATTNPLPGGDSLTKPPPIVPVKPNKTKAGNKNTNKVTNSTGSSNNTVSNSNNNNKSNKKKKGKKKKPHKSLGLFTDGVTPASAEEFTSSGSQGTSTEADHTTDNNPKTAWTATKGGVGVMVEPSSPPYSGIGIVSATPGYSVAVYYTPKSDPPKDVSDWKPVGTTSSASKHERFSFDGNAKNADHYLVWITGLSGSKVSINEIQLFQ